MEILTAPGFKQRPKEEQKSLKGSCRSAAWAVVQHKCAYVNQQIWLKHVRGEEA